MGQWSELPEQFLEEKFLEAIEERVVLYADKVRLRSVCVSWHSTLPKLPHQNFHQSPCLLLPSRNNSVTTCGLFSPLDKKFYHLELPQLAEGKLFIGSSHGWVVTCEDSSSLRLFNPLTRAQLKLPARSCFPDIESYYSSDSGYEYALRDYLGYAYTLSARHVRDHYMHKIILSTSPANDDYIAVAAYGVFNRLAFCRKGYKKWVHLHGERLVYADIIFFGGQLYALDLKGCLLICEVRARPKVTKIMEIVEPRTETERQYLVEYSGGLLMVEKMFSVDRSVHLEFAPSYIANRTCGFKVYKLDVSRSSWLEVRDLGGDSLFLGKNSSWSISSVSFPGCKGNCIYFTDDNREIHEAEFEGVSFDMGIYNLDDGMIESLDVPGYEGDGKKMFCPPLPQFG